MRVLVCGSRTFNDQFLFDLAMNGFLDEFEPRASELVIISGLAKGADTMAVDWAKKNNVTYEGYPAQWDKYGRAAGPVRNQQMLDTGVDLVIAFPKGEAKGTRHMMKIAKEKGVEIRAVE